MRLDPSSESTQHQDDHDLREQRAEETRLDVDELDHDMSGRDW